MPRIFCIVLVLLFMLKAYSQEPMKVNTYTIPIEKAGEKQLILYMPFGSADIVKTIGDTSSLREAGDIMVDIVCTDYPSNLPLTELNKQRIESLFTQFPYIGRKQLITQNIYRQLDGSDKQTAINMFHGLVIRYRPKQTVVTMKKDIAKLEEMLEPEKDADRIYFKSPAINDTLTTKTNNSINNVISSKSRITDTLSEEVFTKHMELPCLITSDTDINSSFPKSALLTLHSKPDTSFVLTPLMAYKRGLFGLSYYKSFIAAPFVRLYYCKGGFSDSSAETAVFDNEDSLVTNSDTAKPHLSPKYHLTDSTVFKILTRNHWKNTDVVGDVTGSMYPYTGQLLLWLKLNTLDSLTTKYAFFNDGDDTPDDKKTIGRTGGIYGKQCKTFEEVKDLVKSTMLRGGGGDCPENDIEALLQAEKQFPNDDYQILIADNWAPIKDKALISQLSKPIRVVLCGTDYTMINVDYLNLARKTKGSVHLINEDIFNLASMHEGELLNIGNCNFKIVNGQFVNTDKPMFQSL